MSKTTWNNSGKDRKESITISRQKTFASDVVDTTISLLEDELKRTGKHLIKTETILRRVSNHIDLTDDYPEREDLLDKGIKQVIQSRLYAHGYFSLIFGRGLFVNVVTCTNLKYLNMVKDNKENVLAGKEKVIAQIEYLINLNGQSVMIPDENNNLIITGTKTHEEFMMDLEADAI